MSVIGVTGERESGSDVRTGNGKNIPLNFF